MYKKIEALFSSFLAEDAPPIKRAIVVVIGIMMAFIILEAWTGIFCNPLKAMPNMPNAYYIYQMKPNLSHSTTATGSVSKGSVSTNQDGFRVTGITVKKPPGVLRVLCLGDSVTFGLDVSDDETYPYYLQKRLSSDYPGREIQVINTGCPGYTIVQGLELLTRKGLCYEPDIIIAGFSHHEFQAASKTDLQRISSPESVKRTKSLLYRSAFYLMLRRIITPSSEYIGTPRDVEVAEGKAVMRVPVDDYKKALQELIDIAARKKIALIFINLPNPGVVLRQQEDEHHVVLNDSVEKNESYFIDLHVELLLYKQNYEYTLMQDLVHPNPCGNKVVADIIANYLKVENIIADTTKEYNPHRQPSAKVEASRNGADRTTGEDLKSLTDRPKEGAPAGGQAGTPEQSK